MRIDGKRFGLVLAGVAMLLGSTAALAKQTFVYVHDRQSGGGIYAFAMSKRGELTPVAGSPFPLVDDGGICGGQCQTMAYSKKRKTLYTGGPTGVSAWTVNPDGTLTSVAGSPFGPGQVADFLGTGVVEAGKQVFVYASSYQLNVVYGWAANPDGSLVDLPGSPFETAPGPDGLATRKKFVFVANEGDFETIPSAISSYLVLSDGTLQPAPGSPVTPPNVDFIYNVSPDGRGKFLYADDGFTGIEGYAVDKKTAALTPLQNSPFPTATFGAGVLIAKKLAYSVGFETASVALQPFLIDKKGNLGSTGITINAPQPIDAYGTDKAAKWLVFAGPNGVATAYIDNKKKGSLTGADIANFPSDSQTNAVVVVAR